MQSKHVPEQNAGTATVYAYNADDTIQSVTDARGASATYGYNNRHLVTSINYSAPAGITTTPNVLFSYDAVGNRTSMTDGLGSQSYSYNQLSQMTSETRAISGLGNYTLGYEYNLAGELKKVTDPTYVTINYNHDVAARVTSVTGENTLYGGVSVYASNIQYRAWGATRSSTTGSNHQTTFSYDARLRPTQFQILAPGAVTAVNNEFSYYNDSSLKYSHNVLNEVFDRAYSYDHVETMSEAYTGAQARAFVNGTGGGAADGPYRQSYQHDAFGNLTSRINRYWTLSDTFTASYVNNRRQDPAWTYDVQGNLLSDADLQYAYDAAARTVTTFSPAASKTIAVAYDGDGQVLKRSETQYSSTTVRYYVRSSVLGGVTMTELNAQGQKQTGYVFNAGDVLAVQAAGAVSWRHENPLTGSRAVSAVGYALTSEVELDPMGVDVGVENPYGSGGGGIGMEFPALVGTAGTSRRCTMDGLELDCISIDPLVATGGAAQCPYNNCGPRFIGGRWESLRFTDEGLGYGNREYSHAQPTNQPKLKQQKPRKPLTPEQRRKAEERRRRDARKGKMAEGPSGGVHTGPTLPIPLAIQNAPRESKDGMNAPCDREIEAIFDDIAARFWGTFNDYVDAAGQTRYKWKFHLPQGITIDNMRQTMQGIGFAEYTNINPDHRPTLPLDLGGFHWQGNVLGNWYHIEFRPTGFWSNEVYAADAHYEADRPSWPRHRTATGKRPCG